MLTFWKKGLAVLLSSVITLAICEVALRVVWHNPYRYEVPDHVLKLNTQHPNTDYLVQIDFKNPQKFGRFRTDARSYLLPSFQYADPDVTIGFLGGSTTECKNVQEDLRFPALVSKLLTERGHKANTLNAGRSGNTLHDSLNILLNHMIDDRPDIVVLMNAANDAGILTSGQGYEIRMGHPVSFGDMGKWALQKASSNLYLAGLLRSWEPASLISLASPDVQGPKPSNTPPPPVAVAKERAKENTAAQAPVDKALVEMYRQRLRAFVEVARAFGIQPVMMTEPFSGSTNALTPDWVYAKPLDQFNAVVREVGEQEGVPVIDLVRHLQEEVPGWNQAGEIFFDGIHVTEKGSRVYAQYITEKLLPIVLNTKTHRSSGSY